MRIKELAVIIGLITFAISFTATAPKTSSCEKKSVVCEKLLLEWQQALCSNEQRITYLQEEIGAADAVPCWGEPRFESKAAALFLDNLAARHLAVWIQVCNYISSPDASEMLLKGFFRRGEQDILLEPAVGLLDKLPSSVRRKYVLKYVMAYRKGFFKRTDKAAELIGAVLATYPTNESSEELWNMVTNHKSGFVTESVVLDYVVACYKTHKKISPDRFDRILAINKETSLNELWALDGVEYLLESEVSRMEYRHVLESLPALHRQPLAPWIELNYRRISRS